jgi:hypothetical protein
MNWHMVLFLMALKFATAAITLYVFAPIICSLELIVRICMMLCGKVVLHQAIGADRVFTLSAELGAKLTQVSSILNESQEASIIPAQNSHGNK